MGKTDAKYEDVKAFLEQMQNWLRYFGGQVFYETKPKNDQFMAEMEWVVPDKKKEWLLKLEPDDYFEGPDKNEIPGLMPVWKFGKRIEGRLCYIKIYLLPKPNVYCISFHFAEHDMRFPLKKVIETI